MADNSINKSKESTEAPSKTPEATSKKETKVGGKTRAEAGKVLAEIGQESADSSTNLEAEGNISEVAAEGPSEDKKGMGSAGAGNDNDDSQQDDSSFVFDEKNLPPVDEIISKIEKKLRNDIKLLQKQAKMYRGGIFRKPDYEKLSDTIGKIRTKRVMISRLVNLAVEAIKSMYISMFKPKKESS